MTAVDSYNYARDVVSWVSWDIFLPQAVTVTAGSGDEDGCAGPLPRFTDDDVDEVLLQ